MPLRPERGRGRADAGVIVNASSRLVVRGNANRVGTEPDGEPGRTTWLEATRLKGDVTGIDWLGTFGDSGRGGRKSSPLHFGVCDGRGCAIQPIFLEYETMPGDLRVERSPR
jgi:hypothetical protein